MRERVREGWWEQEQEAREGRGKRDCVHEGRLEGRKGKWRCT